MALERLKAFPGCDIPHHHLAITAGADDLVALESDSIHRTLMPLESIEESEGAPVPDTDEGVLRATDDVLIVDTEVENTSAVSVEDGRNLGPGSVSKQSPHNDRTVAAAGDHETRGGWIIDIPILVEFQAEDATSMTPEGS